VGLFDTPHPQSPQKSIKMNFVNEMGLYNVILRSDKPNAKQFRRWITHEVLPSIRKTGGYNLPQTLPDALRLAADLAEQNEQLTKDNAIMQPKAEYYDTLVDRHLLTGLRETAKEFGIKEKDFINWLLQKYLYRDERKKIQPRAEYIQRGYFETKEWANEVKAGLQTLITPKGRKRFRTLLNIGKDNEVRKLESAI